MLPNQCIEGDPSMMCQSEGVDNSVIQWSSDFFIAACMIVFAMHLTCCVGDLKEDIRRSGVLAQIFMGSAYACIGIGRILYPNSGLDDNRGMLGSWITSLGFAVFFALSGWLMGQFGMEVGESTGESFRVGCSSSKSSTLVMICQLFLAFSACAYLTGGIWCSINPDIQVNSIVDDEVTDDTEDHVCFRIMYISNVTLHMSYALLWIPVGAVFLGGSRQWTFSVLGFANSNAAALAVLLQWSVGSMIVVYIAFASFVEGNSDTTTIIESSYDTWITVLYHWAMLLTMYSLHNLSFTLTEIEEDWWAVGWDWFMGVFGFDRHPARSKAEDSPSSKSAKIRTSKRLESDSEESQISPEDEYDPTAKPDPTKQPGYKEEIIDC